MERVTVKKFHSPLLFLDLFRLFLPDAWRVRAGAPDAARFNLGNDPGGAPISPPGS